MSENLNYHGIVERRHSFLNPTSEVKLDRLITACGVRDGDRVLDVGCGKAWLLRRMAAAHRIEAVGVDIHATFLDEARTCIEREGVGSRFTLIHAPARSYAAEPTSFDIGLCIGATFAIGSFEAMVAWLKPLVRKGGVIAIGDIYVLDRDPPTQVTSLFAGGATRTLNATVDMLAAAGWEFAFGI